VRTPISKNERVLNLLAYLLSSHRPVPFSEIREHVAGYDEEATGDETVSRRFERDKQTLRELGVDLVYREKRSLEPGGYMVPRPGGFLREINLDRDEVSLLVSLAAFGCTGSRPLLENLAAACQKLLARSALHEPETAPVRSLVYMREAGEDDDTAANLELLALAVERRQRVLFTYYSIHRDSTDERRIEPYGLKFSRGVWYIVGWSAMADAVRIFRLDRVRGGAAFENETKTGQFQVPRDFDINEYVGRSPWQLSTSRALNVCVELTETGAWLVEEAQPQDVVLEPRPEGALARLRVRNVPGFFKWLHSLDTNARIVSPPELAEEYLRFLRRLKRSWPA